MVATVITRPEVDQSWLPSLGVRWQFAVDGISAPLLLLTASLGIAVVVHARSHAPHGGSLTTFYGCLLLVEFGALATFLSRDAVVFFLSFEIVLIPMWMLISRFGDSHDLPARADASGRFVLYTVLGSTLMLVGILALVHSAGTANLDELAKLRGAGLDRSTQMVIAALLLVGLGIKIPLWPFHTWLPPAHTIAPTAGSVLLAAILLKMGTYGIVRLVVAPLLGLALAPVFAAAGVVGILWGGLACLVENDRAAHRSLFLRCPWAQWFWGCQAGRPSGFEAARCSPTSPTVSSPLLFFLVGGLKRRLGSATWPGHRTSRTA